MADLEREIPLSASTPPKTTSEDESAGFSASSAKTVLEPAANKAVPNNTEQTPIEYFLRENLWRRLNISFMSHKTPFHFEI